MQIIPGSSNKELAKRLAAESGWNLLDSDISYYGDGELKVVIDSHIDKRVAILQSTSFPANDHLMETIFLASAARRAGANEIILVIPYFGYSRHDRCLYKNGPVGASAVIRMLESSGITKVLTVDLHSSQLEGFFDVPIINIENIEVFGRELAKNADKDTIIISPDIGGISRARRVSMHLGLDLAIINKSRDSHDQVHMSEVYGDVRDKRCIIIDDIVDSAGTLCKAARLLEQRGARIIEACVTHPVLSDGAIDLIDNSSISTIYISDSIEQISLPKKFKIVHLGKILSGEI